MVEIMYIHLRLKKSANFFELFVYFDDILMFFGQYNLQFFV